MAILKCKMCGGDLKIKQGSSVCECEYCGTKQTVPNADDEKKTKLFDRANRLRSNFEFDKACNVYEGIVSEFPEEAEGYWGLLLCKYGVEYVDDPATGNKVPTCHRSSFDGIMDDPDFELVMEYADSQARGLYRDEAKKIEEIRKGIIEVSGREKPYDIFICYKETDENGSRTIDSVLAQDACEELTKKGYRVFFSRISLEDKLGVEYEPYIFAALNSAKVMLAFGTSYDNYNAVWVKNEWGRYLQIMARDKEKHLIPCFKDIDAYDMPKEFARFQAQDMGKVGAVQDLVRGVDKLIGKKEGGEEQGMPLSQESSPKLSAIMKRGWLALEDGEWDNARKFFDEALNYDAENAMAYLGLACASHRAHSSEELPSVAEDFDKDLQYGKFLRFANEKEKEISEKLEELAIEARKKREEEQKRRAEENRKQKEERQKQEEEIRKKNQELLKRAQDRNRIANTLFKINNGNVMMGLCTDGSAKGKTQWQEYGDTKSKRINWKDVIMIDCGPAHVVGLYANGHVVSEVSARFKDQEKEVRKACDTSQWCNMVSISAGERHTVGLCSDGSVKACGNNQFGECNVSKWKNISKIFAGYNNTFGICSDGSVKACGRNDYGQCNVSEWKNIVNIISGGIGGTFGIQSNGDVVYAGNKDLGGISHWKNLTKLSPTIGNLWVGLSSDGIAHTLGEARGQEWKIGDYTNIVDIACPYDNIIVLLADGRVGWFGKDTEDTVVWQDLDAVAVFAFGYGAVALTRHGSIVGCMRDEVTESAAVDVVKEFEGITLFNDIDKIEEERAEARKNIIQTLTDEKERILNDKSILNRLSNMKQLKCLEELIAFETKNR